MSAHRQFEVQLENLRNEAGIAARYIYADMAVQHAVSKSQKLLNRLNRTPTFWIACGAAFQSAAYMSLGRVFDTKSKFNVAALLYAMEANLALFQREALATRKRDGKTADPPWLPDYLGSAYYPTARDVARLRKKVNDYRVVYVRAVKPARNKYLAHRETQDHAEVSALFGRGTLKDLWRLTTFLLQLHSILSELLHNGRKPVFGPIRYSVKTIFDAKTQRSQTHESIVREVKELMYFIENATPNHACTGPFTGGASHHRFPTGEGSR
jgi:hypothetical protein